MSRKPDPQPRETLTEDHPEPGRLRSKSGREQAEIDVEAFSYTVSHDLRSPLGAILNFSTLLQEEYADQLDEDGQDWLNRIDRNARRAVAMMDSLLAYSRVGKAEMSLVPIDLGELFHTALAENFSEEARKEIHLQVDEVPRVYCDRSLLTQLAVQLLSNASSFAAPPDGCVVRVSAEPCPSGICVTVRDDGPGFTTPNADSAFQLFQRFHPSGPGTRAAGLGTGLATIKRIVERHGGSIRIESSEGAGTAVIFDLELADQAAHEDPA